MQTQQVHNNITIYILVTEKCRVPNTVLQQRFFSKRTSLDNGIIYEISDVSLKTKKLLTEELPDYGFSKIFEGCWISNTIKTKPDHPIYPIFFEIIAGDYDHLIDKRKNISCYDFFGYLALLEPRTTKLRGLDFGCGTGIITESNFFKKLEKLIGIDSCPAMLNEARKRGMEIALPDAITNMKQGSVDIIVSVYVLHYGVSFSTLLSLVFLLAPNGKMIANIHKNIHLVEYHQWCKGLNPDEFNFELQVSEFGTILIITRLPY